MVNIGWFQDVHQTEAGSTQHTGPESRLTSDI